MRPCCDGCCFKDQIEAHRNQAEKELKDLLIQWMKKHSEVERVLISHKGIFSNSVSLNRKSEIDITVYFDKY